MKRVLPPFVYAVEAKGKTYHYFRKDGANVRVDPSAPDFWTTYADLKQARAPVPKTVTFGGLIASYEKSARFKRLADRTKADYGKVLAFIKDRFRGKNPANLRRVHVVQLQEANEGRFAQYLVQVMNVLMEHAIDIGWRDDNPAKGVTLKPIEKRKPHEPWTDEAIATFRGGVVGLPHLIFEIGLGTVQRPDDWTRFDWEHFDGKAIHMRQGKTGAELVIPCPAPLLAALEANRPKVMNINGCTPILTTGKKRMTYRRMAEIMLAERKRLGLSQYDLHALRYRGVMDLAWAGCTDEEIASISGHKSMSMVKKYAGIARQIMRARQANAKRKRS